MNIPGKSMLSWTAILLLLSGCVTTDPGVIPPENTSGGAAAAAGAWNVPDSPYFPSCNFYQDNPTRTLLKLERFKTCQQSTDSGCGAVCALMTLEWFGGNNLKESELARELDIRYLDNRRPDGGYGCLTSALAQFFQRRGFVVQSSLDCRRKNGKTFDTAEEFSTFLQSALRSRTVVLLENVAWGGHWVVLIGYDTMGTADIGDDVLIFADPYDTSDHCQDGYVIKSFDRFFYEWFDAGVLTKGITPQPFVAVRK